MTVVLFAALVTVIFGVLELRAYRVPSESMVPTLELDDRFVTSDVSDPERGDIVVFRPPPNSANATCAVRLLPGSPCPRSAPGEDPFTFVHRVVAVGGDKVAVNRGRVVLNGRLQDESYIQPDPGCDFCNLPRPITVPEGYVYVMGDNRGASADSRVWGPVRKDAIRGRVSWRYWPLGRFGNPG